MEHIEEMKVTIGDAITSKRNPAKPRPDDPFAIIPIEEIDAKAEDLKAAKERRDAVAAEEAEIQIKTREFAQTIFPVMTGLTERREEARGISKKNFDIYETQITEYMKRKPPIGPIATTAYIMAAVKIVNPEVLVRDLVERNLIKQVSEGTIVCGRQRFSLAFEPIDEHRVAILQALRERFGEAEQIARQDHRQKVHDLLATGKLSVWDLFNGKPGRFAFYRPFEIVKKGKNGNEKTFVFKPGVVAGESDGRQISFSVGLGGVEKIICEVHEAGLVLSCKSLNDPEFWTKKDELKPLISVHRTLWSIRRYLEAQGQGSAAESAVLDLLGNGNEFLSPEKFFSSNDEGKTLVLFDEKDNEGKSKPWRVYVRAGIMRDGENCYNPMYNFAAVLSRADDKVCWIKYPAHLEAVFKGSIGKSLETPEGKKMVFGSPGSFYQWAKRKYGPLSQQLKKT